jgi:hypothetical protein
MAACGQVDQVIFVMPQKLPHQFRDFFSTLAVVEL